MTWKPRLIDEPELGAYYDLSSTMFGIAFKAPEDYRKQLAAWIEPARTFVIDDDGQLVGTAGAFTLALALPGGTLPMAGVTMVGVRPTHRRQGMLRLLMDAVIDQAIEQGEPLAGLTASEGTIYRRFGFGVAVRYHDLEIDTTRSAEVVEVQAPGRLRLIGEQEAETVLPAVWERVWRARVGEITRPDGFWEGIAVDPEADRDGASARFLVVHEDPDGFPDGFAVYRMKESETPVGGSFYDLRVGEIAGSDDAVEATLLRYLMDVDLAGILYWHAAPTDLPLRWRLADSRALTVTKERDHLWLRLLDVARCLSSRTYAVEGAAVVEVVDEARPELGGRFGLLGNPEGAECTRTDADADVVIRSADLGAALLGGVSWATLQRAGLVDEQKPGTVARLDAMFHQPRAPHCATGF